MLTSASEKKEQIKQAYKKALQQGNGGCCEPNPTGGGEQIYQNVAGKMKGHLAKLAGYEKEQLESLPQGAVANSFGCGNPLAFLDVRPGETVVDIGSGAGIDCFLAAKRVGPSGRVIGLDMTPEMIAKARANAKEAGFGNVEFRLGDAEKMPIEDNSADWVISNCVINLSPDKDRVFREIVRVLRPGGRVSISDIVTGETLPASIRTSVEALVGCVAGALEENDYLQRMRNAGLVDIHVTERLIYRREHIEGFLASGSNTHRRLLNDIAKIDGKIWSAKISARKPDRARHN